MVHGSWLKTHGSEGLGSADAGGGGGLGSGWTPDHAPLAMMHAPFIIDELTID